MLNSAHRIHFPVLSLPLIFSYCVLLAQWVKKPAGMQKLLNAERLNYCFPLMLSRRCWFASADCFFVQLAALRFSILFQPNSFQIKKPQNLAPSICGCIVFV